MHNGNYPQPHFYHRSIGLAFRKRGADNELYEIRNLCAKIDIATQRYFASFVFSLSLHWRERNSEIEIILRFATSRRYNLSGPITLRWLVLSIQPFFSKTSFFLRFSYRSVATGYAIVSIWILLTLYACHVKRVFRSTIFVR